MNEYRNTAYYEDSSYPETRFQMREREGWWGVLMAVLKRPWMVILSLLIIFLPALFFIFSRPPLYRSSAILSMRLSEQNRLSFLPTELPLESSGEAEQYYISILESHSYRQDITRRLREKFPHLDPDSINQLVSGGAVKYERRPRAPGFVNLYATARDPALAHSLCEAAVSSFQTLSAGLRRTEASSLQKFVEDQLASLNNQLGVLEDEIQRFLREKRLTIEDLDLGIDSELRALERSLAEAQAARDLAWMQVDAYTQQLNQRIKEILASARDRSDEAILTTLKNRLDQINIGLNRADEESDSLNFRLLQAEKRKILNQMVAQTTEMRVSEPENPTPQVSIKTIEESLEKWMLDYETAQVKVMFYQTAINNFMKDHPNLSSDILEYLNLARSREVLRRTIDILVEQRERIRLKMASETGGVTVIDPPSLPDSPVSQRRGLKVAGVAAVALMLGIALAYIFDLFDNTVQGEREIQTRFKLPVLGSIPVLSAQRFLPSRRRSQLKKGELSSKNSLDATHLDLYSESSPIAEAYRSIRTALLFTAKDKGQNIFILTSPVAGDGKSINTYNIGVSMAQGGQKTLILDADLRRSSQHKIFGVERSPGLTELLKGETYLQEALRPHRTIPNLWILPAGSRVSNPADLTSSPQMKALLEDLSHQFDMIIIDTPPVTPCMDSRYLGMITGGLVMIVRAESTKLSALEQSINLCQRVNVDIWGVLVNHASFRYGYGYYYVYQRYSPYGYYYSGYQYQYYYTQDEETGERIRKKRKVRRPREKDTSQMET